MERETRNCSLFVSHAIQSLCQRLLPSLCTASLLQAIYDIYLAWFGFSVRTEKYEMNEYADYVKTVHTHTNAVRWVSIRHKSSIHDDVRLVFLHAEIYRYMSQHHNIWHTHKHTQAECENDGKRPEKAHRAHYTSILCAVYPMIFIFFTCATVTCKTPTASEAEKREREREEINISQLRDVQFNSFTSQPFTRENTDINRH